MKYYIVVMRFENWRINQKIGFRELGFKKRVSPTISRMLKGDKIVIYIASMLGCVSGVYSVDKEMYKSTELKWDEFFDYRIGVQPRLLLSEAQFVDFRCLVPSLRFVKIKKHWNAYIRKSIREIPKSDFELINRVLLKARGGKFFRREATNVKLRRLMRNKHSI